MFLRVSFLARMLKFAFFLSNGLFCNFGSDWSVQMSFGNFCANFLLEFDGVWGKAEHLITELYGRAKLCLWAVTAWISCAEYASYLDLHLALFSAHSSFRLDLRSFWLFMLTWPRKHTFLSWRTGIYVFSRVFTLISRENTLIILASKCTKRKNAKSGAITLMWRKRAQKAEISQMSNYLCFFEDTGISNMLFAWQVFMAR